MKAEGLDARSVLQKLRDVFSEIEVDQAAHFVAQCYDGANVMEGRLNVATQRIRCDPGGMALLQLELKSLSKTRVVKLRPAKRLL